MTQLRPHSTSFEESKRQCVHLLTGNVADVIAYLRCNFPQYRVEARDLRQVYCGPDERNDWDTWLIRLRNVPVAWTDGPIIGIANIEVIGGARGLVLSSP
jgi:hypothetical protein